jgi:hypothetical protein
MIEPSAAFGQERAAASRAWGQDSGFIVRIKAY